MCKMHHMLQCAVRTFRECFGVCDAVAVAAAPEDANDTHRDDARSFDSRYRQLGSTVGTGAFSRVTRAWDVERSEHVVCKHVILREKKQLFNEIATYKHLGRHPNIPAMLAHAAFDPAEDMYSGVIVLRYTPSSEDLLQFLLHHPGNIAPPHAVRPILDQVVRALQHVHANGLAHKDVKLENIIISQHRRGAALLGKYEYKVQLIDFGLACKVGTLDNDRICGTFTYLPPELLYTSLYCDILKSPPETVLAYDMRPSDMWALGIVAFCMVYGRQPFVHKAQIYQVLKKNHLALTSLFSTIVEMWSLTTSHPLSNEILTFLEMTLYADPDHRPKASDLAPLMRAPALRASSWPASQA